MTFKIYNCDFGMKIESSNYDFPHVMELQVEDPEKNELTRGSNAKNKIGIAHKSGLKDPKRWTIPILAMSAALKAVLDGCYEDQTRLECYCIDRTDGSSKMLRNAILANRPQQLTIDESAESMNVQLEFISFESSEVHKS